MKKDILISRIINCIEIANSLKHSRYKDRDESKADTIYGKWFNQTTTCLIDIFGPSHTYSRNFQNTCSFKGIPNIDEGIGILIAAREDIENGYINSLFGLISADIFSNILEIAEHFLDEKYKDPAAVTIGIALETHLKTLCQTNGIPVEFEDEKGALRLKKASTLNHDLCKIQIYNKLDEKLVTAWLDLRNKSAHGQFDEYSIDQVKNMLLGVTEFINRTK